MCDDSHVIAVEEIRVHLSLAGHGGFGIRRSKRSRGERDRTAQKGSHDSNVKFTRFNAVFLIRDKSAKSFPGSGCGKNSHIFNKASLLFAR